MRANLALALERIPNRAEPLSDSEDIFTANAAAIRSIIVDLEKASSATNNLRHLDNIVREFVVNGTKRASVPSRIPDWRTIWALLKEMAEVRSHDAAVEELRRIQSEYRGFVSASQA